MEETVSEYISVQWQEGCVSESGVNGCQIEDVIQFAIDRIRLLNTFPFDCRENYLAVTDLESAQNWLKRRTSDRTKRGVEGRDIP